MVQTIYIVDDDPTVLRTLERALIWRDFSVETFESAQSFLETYETQRNGCLILDVKMQGMTGLELQQEMNRQGNSLPIIFITGHGGAEEKEVALSAGAIEFLEKPFSQATLVDCIQRAFEQDASDQRSEQPA